MECSALFNYERCYAIAYIKYKKINRLFKPLCSRIMRKELNTPRKYGEQVAKYLKETSLSTADLAQMTKSNTDNVRAIIRGDVSLTLAKMIKIADLFGITYYEFADPNFPIPAYDRLPEKTKVVILRRKKIGTPTRDYRALLAKNLDKLIQEAEVNVPTTSAILLGKMDKQLETRNPSEITNLLRKPPRNKFIVPLTKIGAQQVFIVKDYLEKYQELTEDEIRALINKSK